MNDELNDVITSFEDEEVTQAEVDLQTDEESEEASSEINAESEPETETNTEDRPKGGNKLQERLDKLTAERYAEKRRADELAAKLAELERSKPEPVSDIQPPELPEDIFDVDAMRKYHADMLTYSRKIAAQEAKQTLGASASEQKAQQEQIEQQKLVQTFAKRTLDSGFSIEQIEQAGTALVNAGLSKELQLMLLEDEAGPQITMYLAKNPDDAFELLSMPTHKAAVAIATKIKAKAVTTKAKATKAPDPIPESRGVSVRDTDEFSRKYKDAKFI